MILRKAVQLTQAVDPNAVGALLAEKMSQYANLLAAQGSIAAALTFLPASTNQVCGLWASCFFAFFHFPLSHQLVLIGRLAWERCSLEVGSRCRFPSGSKAGPVAAFLLQERWIAVP